MTSPPFQQVAMPALDVRRMMLGVIDQEGVVGSGDLTVSQRAAGANMSADVSAGQAFVLGDDAVYQGAYAALNDAVTNVTGFAAAHATLPRIDRVVLEVRDAFHGGAANDLRFQVLPGTATAGATLANTTGAAAVGNNRLLLANVLVPAAATTITDANIDTTVRKLSSSGARAIYDTIVAAAGASIDITGIPAGYAHLRIACYLRSDAATNNVNLQLRFNNDSGASYDFEQLYGSAAAVAASETFAAAQVVLGAVPAGTAPANVFGQANIEIAHYAGLNNKTLNAELALKYGVVTGNLLRYSTAGFWRSNAAINRVTLLLSSGNFVVGSRVTVYAMGA